MQGQGSTQGQQGLGVPQQTQPGLRKKSSGAQLADINDRLHWPEFSALKGPFVNRYDDLAKQHDQLQPNAINNLFDNCMTTSSAARRQTLRGDIDKLYRDVKTSSDSARNRQADHNAYSIRSGWTGDLSAPSFGSIDSQHYHGQAEQGSSAVTTPTMPAYTRTHMLGNDFPGVSKHTGRLIVQGQQDATVDVYVDAHQNAAYWTMYGWCGLVRTA